MVIRDEPSTSFVASSALSALSFGTLSPKRTTFKYHQSQDYFSITNYDQKSSQIIRRKSYFGLSTPLHFGQVGIWKSSSQIFSSISMSPSSLCFMPKLSSNPGLPWSKLSIAATHCSDKSFTWHQRKTKEENAIKITIIITKRVRVN